MKLTVYACVHAGKARAMFLGRVNAHQWVERMNKEAGYTRFVVELWSMDAELWRHEE